MIKDGKASSLNTRGRIIGLAIGICLLPIFFLFAHFGQPARGLATACVVGVFVVVVYVKRKIISNVWFLVVISILFAIHLFLVLSLPFPSSNFPGIIALPISIVDLLLILALVHLVENLTGPTD